MEQICEPKMEPEPGQGSGKKPHPGAENARKAGKKVAFSKLTNGKWLPKVPSTSTWCRRLKDLVRLYTSDLGGPDNCSEAEASILRRAAALTVECERLEQVMALAEDVNPEVVGLYSRASNTLRRHLEATGLRRRLKDVTPSVEKFIATYGEDDVADAEVVE
jgi:hypothetical protein